MINGSPGRCSCGSGGRAGRDRRLGMPREARISSVRAGSDARHLTRSSRTTAQEVGGRSLCSGGHHSQESQRQVKPRQTRPREQSGSTVSGQPGSQPPGTRSLKVCVWSWRKALKSRTRARCVARSQTDDSEKQCNCAWKLSQCSVGGWGHSGRVSRCSPTSPCGRISPPQEETQGLSVAKCFGDPLPCPRGGLPPSPALRRSFVSSFWH